MYLFSTRDDVVDGSEFLSQESGSPKSAKAGQSAEDRVLPHIPGSLISMARNELMEADIDAAEAEEEDGSSSSDNSENDDDDEDEDEETDNDLSVSDLNDRYRRDIPVVLPRRKFVGACNVETVKDGALVHDGWLLVLI